MNKEEIKSIIADGDFINAHFYRTIESMPVKSIDTDKNEVPEFRGGDLDAVKKNDVLPLASHIQKLFESQDYKHPFMLHEQTGYAIGTGMTSVGKFQLISHKNTFYSVVTIRQTPTSYIYCSTDQGMKDFWATDPINNHFQAQVGRDNKDLANLDPSIPHDHHTFEGGVERIFKHRPDLIGRVPGHLEQTFLIEIGDVEDVSELTSTVWKNAELRHYLAQRLIGELKSGGEEKEDTEII
ncbi:MAG: hypothetical protein H8D23_11105 [Candidatus Brocadiales bacterium]|nr:hypothetical protein [Candidatus Brocadiales bacterium]